MKEFIIPVFATIFGLAAFVVMLMLIVYSIKRFAIHLKEKADRAAFEAEYNQPKYHWRNAREVPLDVQLSAKGIKLGIKKGSDGLYRTNTGKIYRSNGHSVGIDGTMNMCSWCELREWRENLIAPEEGSGDWWDWMTDEEIAKNREASFIVEKYKCTTFEETRRMIDEDHIDFQRLMAFYNGKAFWEKDAAGKPIRLVYKEKVK